MLTNNDNILNFRCRMIFDLLPWRVPHLIQVGMVLKRKSRTFVLLSVVGEPEYYKVELLKTQRCIDRREEYAHRRAKLLLR